MNAEKLAHIEQTIKAIERMHRTGVVTFDEYCARVNELRDAAGYPDLTPEEFMNRSAQPDVQLSAEDLRKALPKYNADGKLVVNELEQHGQDGGGLAYNAGKARYDLLPPDAIAELVRVYTLGAEKYAERNWERGMLWSKRLASLKRHTAAWELGEDLDPELGTHHMANVAWNALALLTYALRDAGTDDRPKIKKVNKN